MARVKGGTVSRNRRKRVLKLAKGYFGSKHILYKTAHEQVMHSFKYAYNDRRKLKGNMRKLWIARINAAAHDLFQFFFFHGTLAVRTGTAALFNAFDDSHTPSSVRGFIPLSYHFHFIIFFHALTSFLRAIKKHREIPKLPVFRS